MRGKLKDLQFTRNGETVISITTRANIAELFDELKDAEIDFDIKKHRDRRSKDANAYMWELCGKLADKTLDQDVKMTKEEIYRAAIREVGVYKDFPNMSQSDAQTLRTAWGMLGTGWITEIVDYGQDGDAVMVRCYYGSSQYNSKQMSRLIDNLVQDCDEQGIPTETLEEIERIKELWAQECAKKGKTK